MRSFLYILLFGFSFHFTVVLSSSKLRKRDSLFDIFGPTKYGFRCGRFTHHKTDLYATALNGCTAWVKNRDKTTCGNRLCQTPDNRVRDISFSEENFQYEFSPFVGPYLLYPILRTLDLFQEGMNLPPGPDRLVINRNCEIVSVITNEAVSGGPPSISACQSQISSLTPPSSPGRAPASPARAPASPGRALASPGRALASPGRALASIPQQPALSPRR